MALFDDLMGALKKALEDKARPTLEKAAAVMAEFEVGVELAREHGKALVQAAQEAAREAEKNKQRSASEAAQDSTIIDVEVVEVEKK